MPGKTIQGLVLTILLISGSLWAGAGQTLMIGDIGPMSPPEIWNTPLGSAYVTGGDRPDFFVYFKDEKTKRYEVYLYPYLRTGAKGEPVFGKEIVCRHDYDKNYVPKYLIEEDGRIICLWRNEKIISISEYQLSEHCFVEKGSMTTDSLPGGSLSPMSFMANPDGTIELILALVKGSYMGEQGKRLHTRSAFFDPFDGAGVWRGEMMTATLYGMTIDGFGETASGQFQMISAEPDEVRLSLARKVVPVNLGPGHERDIVGGGQFGNIHYYHNTAAEGVKLDRVRCLAGRDGIILRHPTIDPSPAVYSQSRGGLSDLICSGEGWHYYYRFTGDFTAEGTPVYNDPVPVLQVQPKLNLSSLPVVNVVDWNGDSLLDIVSGNSPGEVLVAYNTGTKEKPAFAMPTPLKDELGQLLCVRPGYRGSVQGPLEARWGYSCPAVADWNSDGLVDVILSGSTAEYKVFINKGTVAEPVLKPGNSIYLDGLELHGTWRTRPAIGDLGGRMALITLDDDDEFHLYRRIDDHNVEDGGKLTLENGKPIEANFRYAGGTGRLKLHLGDWDSDGRQDLLVGTMVESCVPDLKTGLPARLGRIGAVILLLRNVGTDTEPKYHTPETLHYKGTPVFLGIHSCSPVFADLNGDGLLDIVSGEETGNVVFFDRNDVEFKLLSPDMIPVLNNRWVDGSTLTNWHDKRNWWFGVPAEGEYAFVQRTELAEIYANDAVCTRLFVCDNTVLKVRDGRRVQVGDMLAVGLYDKHDAKLIIEDGEVNVAGNMIVGKRVGSLGEVVINNGTVTAGGLLFGPEGGSGRITIHRNGKLILTGNCLSTIEKIKDNIHAADGLLGIDIQHNESDNQTVVTAY